MNGNSIALDTTVAIKVLNDTDGIGEWIKQFDEILLPIHVVGELRFGAANSQRPAENIARIDALTASSRVLNTTLMTAAVYAEIRLELNKAGTPIPENDLWIAALCAENSVSLATNDSHFQKVSRITILQP